MASVYIGVCVRLPVSVCLQLIFRREALSGLLWSGSANMWFDNKVKFPSNQSTLHEDV
jgi:hypothetical protein